MSQRRAAQAETVAGQISMPIKSKAQRRKFAELLVKGEISPETFEEWNRAAGSAELPERLHPKVAVKRKRKVKSKRAPKPKIARAKKGSRPARKRG
jgi:macrodomain Ter protein organizer (MatP/YcbG family)